MDNRAGRYGHTEARWGEQRSWNNQTLKDLISPGDALPDVHLTKDIYVLLNCTASIYYVINFNCHYLKWVLLRIASRTGCSSVSI